MNNSHDEFKCWLRVIGGINSRLSSIQKIRTAPFKDLGARKSPWMLTKAIMALAKPGHQWMKTGSLVT